METKQIEQNQIVTAIKQAESNEELDLIIRTYPIVTLDDDVNSFIKLKRHELQNQRS
jgi:hypothetical protein